MQNFETERIKDDKSARWHGDAEQFTLRLDQRANASVALDHRLFPNFLPGFGVPGKIDALRGDRSSAAAGFNRRPSEQQAGRSIETER